MPLARTILNIWQRTQGIKDLRSSFDITRFNQSRMFINQFAEEKRVKTSDGKVITYMVFRPEIFRAWILDNGGKITNKSDHVLIVAQDDVAWNTLQQLREFRCFEEVNRSFKMPRNISGANNKCILRCQGFGRQIPMDKKYIGMHLALGFNYAVFNWRENVSLPNFFKDAEAVYHALITKEGFSSNQLIAMGSCRATFVVAHLKEKYHANGLDAVLIHPVPSLSTTINVKKGLVRTIGLLGLKGLEKTGAHFDNLRRLRSIRAQNSRTFIILNEGDETLPENAKELFKEAMKHHRSAIIWQIPKKPGSDPHFSDPLLSDRTNFDTYARFLARNQTPPRAQLI